MNPNPPITVLLAEDHQIVREGLKKLLEAEPDITVVAEAGNGREAVALSKKLKPEVVVMDIAMPVLNGLEATRQLLLAVPATRVVILSAYSEDAYVEQVMGLGSAGYLLKQSSAHFLAEAIRAVHRGEAFFSPSITRQYARHGRRLPDAAHRPPPPDHRLTSRETEVLQLIAEGQANKQVAAELVISVKTVEKHRQRLMEKLNIHDTAGLTRHAIASGMIESRVRLTIL